MRNRPGGDGKRGGHRSDALEVPAGAGTGNWHLPGEPGPARSSETPARATARRSSSIAPSAATAAPEAPGGAERGGAGRRHGGGAGGTVRRVQTGGSGVGLRPGGGGDEAAAR